MSVKKKTVFKTFDYMHCDDFAKFLSEMAAKGWHFKEWGLGLKFEQGEPEQVVYAVEVFTDASEYDLRPEANTTLNFAEYCREAGWELVDAKRKFCIFKRVQEDAVPILTQEERVENTYKERNRELIPGFVISAMMLTMQVLDLSSKYLFPARIFSPFTLSLLILWATGFIERCVKLIGLWMWKRKMKQKLAAGETIYLGNDSGKLQILSKSGFWISIIIELMCIAMIPEKWLWQLVVFFIGLLLSILVLSMILAKVRPESNTNFIIQTAFSMFYIVTILIVAVCFGELERQDRIQAEAPLMKEDYVEFRGEVESITLYDDRNILGRSQKYLISYEDREDGLSSSLHYFKYSSEVEWIMDRIWQLETDMWSGDEWEECTQEWEANIAFYDGNKTYCVRYDDIILIFDDYDERVLAQEQIDIIRDKLELR